jgi:hypothetical protein
MIKYFVIAISVLLMTAIAGAATGVSFLEIPVGARESALGGCGAALITGPTSVTYNPASAALMPRSVALMESRHFGDTHAQFVGFTVRHGALAISPHYWGTRTSDFEYRTQPSAEPISMFDAVNSSLGATVALNLAKHYSIGLTGRYIWQKIQTASADGYGLDAGAMAQNVLLPGLTLGVAAQHLGKMSMFTSEHPRLPATVRGGAAYDYVLPKIGSLLITADAQAVRDNKPQFKGGLEYRAPGFVALRAGYVSGLDAQNVSLGVGLFYRMIRLDYAFIPYKEDLGEGHRFSLTFDI